MTVFEKGVGYRKRNKEDILGHEGVPRETSAFLKSQGIMHFSKSPVSIFIGGSNTKYAAHKPLFLKYFFR
jgi:hypothetical protein